MLALAWDAENERHITRRHGISRDEVEQALQGETLQLGRILRSGEWRVTMLGRTHAGVVLFLVVTVLEPGMVRAVTAFPAKRKLRALYDKYLGEKQ